jgi:ferredoxin-type protein NapH
MQISRTIRRTIAGIILTAGLAYPVCAAVCPKGRGFCPDPGRCFLYVDADKNALCDYTTPGSGQVAGAVPTPAGAPAQTIVPPTSAPASVPTAVQENATAGVNTISGGFLDSVHISPLIEGVVLFVFLTGILFLLLRYGVLGVQVRKTRPALALSAFLGLGISLVADCILAGDTSAGTTYALVFMGAGSPLAAYLWYSGVMTRKLTIWTALVGTLAGLVFVAPMMPMEIGGLVNVLTGVSALVPGIVVICAVVLFALVAGRTFCGNICPVGSLQELAYNVPSKKKVIRKKEILEVIRVAVFIITVVAAVYLVDLMAMTGLYDLFSLTLSTGFVVAAGLIVLSVFLYRPVCRILCPFGVLFSLCAEFSWFRLHRTDACIRCRKCEKACPASTAAADDQKRECYLCGRCTDVCPKEGALVFRH